MLVVISPAKRLDWAAADAVEQTGPAFQADATTLARVAARLSQAELRSLMHISDDLAKLNQARFKAFLPAPVLDDVRPAALAFAGDTYVGLEARSLDRDAMDWAQGHLRILSGLYGVLRPCDSIQPYRLEMGSKLKTRKGGSLYAYWGDRIATALNEVAQQTGSRLLVNCASQEYFGAVDMQVLDPDVVTPVFLEDKPGGPKVVSFYAKRARGAMARFIVERRITELGSLQDFDAGGYVYQPGMSEQMRPVFLRSQDANGAPA
jgi:cytoplasmic iron level regulating protein YaaA (DUF328/UPF0246 family)